MAVLFVQNINAQSPDSLNVPSGVNEIRYIKSNEFFDALQERSKRSILTEFIVSSLISNNDWRGNDARDASQNLINEESYFCGFEGKEITNIYVLPQNVYSDSLSTFFTRTVNALHYTTRENVLRKYLLFEEGDKVDPLTMIRNEEVLRSLRFISDAYIVLTARDSLGEAGKVDVFVYSRDHWSIDLDVDEKASGEYGIYGYEYNFLGLGHRLTLGTYFLTDAPHIAGYILGYDAENLWGSFFRFSGLADRSREQYTYSASLQKPFIRPTDYSAGVRYSAESIMERQLLADTVLPVQRQTIDVWSGVSWKFKGLANTLFLTGRWTNLIYRERGLNVEAALNPYYHDKSLFLASTGIYRESFYRGSYIFGYANSEDIPYGYKVELTGGYLWGEFYDCYYFCSSLSAGQRIPIGFMSGSINYGSFFTQDWQPQQSVLSVQLNYFTNLFKLGTGSIRNFISLEYITGIHRLEGERERVTYNGENMRILELHLVGGLNRMLLRLESVYFSPVYFYNFRFAFYTFSDMGWLGDDYNVLANDFSLSAGLGIRIKNDRLIFTSIQLQFGYAIVNPGKGTSKWFSLGNEPRVNAQRYRPNNPSIVGFQ
ncbi:MAG: hypothetical protein LBH91_08430 [Prevotellaceae bacterium]|nr:hypothetical protein [Prevotellaceae bacterium]